MLHASDGMSTPDAIDNFDDFDGFLDGLKGAPAWTHASGMKLSPDAMGWPKTVAAMVGAPFTPYPPDVRGVIRLNQFLKDQNRCVVTTGLFRPKTPRTKINLVALNCIAFDADCATWLAGTYPQKYWTDGMAKAEMRGMQHAELSALLGRFRDYLLDKMIAVFGVPPTRMVCSGYGFHMWYHLDSTYYAAHEDFQTIMDAPLGLVNAVNNLAFPDGKAMLLDRARTDTGVGCFAIVGTYNTKEKKNPRLVSICGWSDTTVSPRMLEPFAGVTRTADALTGAVRVTRTRPAYEPDGGGGAVTSIDFKSMVMRDGRSLYAITQRLAKGDQMRCDPPAPHDGHNSMVVRRMKNGDLWAVHFGSIRRVYVHTPMGALPIETSSVESKTGGVPPEDPPSPPRLTALLSSGKTEDNNDANLGGYPPVSIVPTPAWSSPEMRAAAYAAPAIDARSGTIDRAPDVHVGLDEDWITAATEGEDPPSPPAHVVERTVARMGGVRRSACAVAPWMHTAKNHEARSMSSMRLACWSYTCPDCAPIALGALTGAAMEVTHSTMNSMGKWRARVLVDTPHARSIERWANAAPPFRRHFSIHTGAHTYTIVMYAGGNAPVGNTIRTSDFQTTFDAEPERDIDATVDLVKKFCDEINPKHRSKKRSCPVTGQRITVGAIYALVDVLKGRTPSAPDPDRVTIVSPMSPSNVKKELESLAHAPVISETKTVTNQRLNAEVGSVVRMGLGSDPTCIGGILQEAIDRGAIPSVNRRASHSQQPAAAGMYEDDLEIWSGTV